LAEPDLAIVKDATGNRFDGTPSDTAPVSATGAIGIGKGFNGISSCFDMKNTANGTLNFAENAVYTVSAWAYADTLDDKFHAIVGKSDNQYFLKLKQYYPPNPMRWEFAEYHGMAGWEITDTLATAKEWKYLVGVRQGARQYFYLDGVLVDTAIEIKADSSARHTGDDVTIGKFLTYSSIDAGYCPFKGKIDEVRISNVVRSADWIKLGYMNQKTPDALVRFK
jgi:trimeric autotransporter adhesin